MPYTIYQAGPLFTSAERFFHHDLSARLRKAGHDVVWPGDLLSDAKIKATNGPVQLIFQSCKAALELCTCMVALLDGPQVDDGTAWEIGYAHAKGMPIYGIRTDTRVAGDTSQNRVNSMIEGCLAGVARDIDELIRMIGVESGSEWVTGGRRSTDALTDIPRRKKGL